MPDEVTIVGPQAQKEVRLYEVETPSGGKVWLNPAEEAEAVKEALREKLVYQMTRNTEIQRAAIGAIGNAIGFAVGGFLVGWFLGKGK